MNSGKIMVPTYVVAAILLSASLFGKSVGLRSGPKGRLAPWRLARFIHVCVILKLAKHAYIKRCSAIKHGYKN